MHVTRVPTAAPPAWTPVAPTRAPARTSTRPPTLWPAWLNGILARAAERRQLLALEPRELRDIGLTPAEAWALARQPLRRR